MYVNSSLTAQRIQKFVLVLGSFGLETALTREKISVWESLFSLKFRWIPKDADLCLSLKSFRWESWNSIRVHGTICWKLCSSKVENSEEKTRRLRIRSSAEFLYSMTCVVICSHRRSHLQSFLQGIFIGRIGGGTFWRLGQNIKESKHLREALVRYGKFVTGSFPWSNKPNESTSGQDTVVWLIDKRHSCPKPKWSGNDLKHLCLARHLLVRTWIHIKHRITFVILHNNNKTVEN